MKLKKYNPLDRFDKWDKETQESIKQRIEKEIGDNYSFFYLTEEQGEILKKLISFLLPQKDVKIAQVIDKSLSDKKQGVRYGENPWKGSFYKQGLEKLSQIELSDQAIKEIKDEFLKSFLKQVLSDSINIYYSHPASWKEIGFPGPAYPEGYAYLDCDEKDNWEPEYE